MDPYEILGVPRGCTRDEAREAFRAKALAAHPDRGGAEGAFIRVRTAYEQIVAEVGRRSLEQVSPRRAWTAPADGDRSKPVILATDPGRAQSGDAQGIRFLDEEDIRYIDDPPDAFASREQYLAWVDRVAAEAGRRDSRRRSGTARWVGAAFLLWVILTIPVALIGGFVWELPEVVKMTERGGPPAGALTALFAMAYLAAPVLAVGIAWKYREH